MTHIKLELEAFGVCPIQCPYLKLCDEMNSLRGHKSSTVIKVDPRKFFSLLLDISNSAVEELNLTHSGDFLQAQTRYLFVFNHNRHEDPE